MGFGISSTQLQPDPIPITWSQRKPVVYLYLIHSYELDPEGEYLTRS